MGIGVFYRIIFVFKNCGKILEIHRGQSLIRQVGLFLYFNFNSRNSGRDFAPPGKLQS